jgi:hypothetical protein
MIKILKDCAYSSNGANCIRLKAGDIVNELPTDLLKIYLEKGKCEMAKADQPPVKEVKIIAPIEEIKEEEPQAQAPQKKKIRKRSRK